MSEHMEKHTISRLIAPPDVGYGEGGSIATPCSTYVNFGKHARRLQIFLKKGFNRRNKFHLSDFFHTLVGAGSTEGSLDASNMFKPALARGELHCIGATTLKEYKKKIEPDSALARRFQTIIVKEPDNQNCVGILRGLKEKYELHHGVRIQDAAIVAASELSDRYVNHRFLPDKAIDLIDEAASKMRMEIDSMPTEIDLLDRTILQLEIEKTALKKEEDDASQSRLKEIENEIYTKQEKRDVSKAQWLEEKTVIEKNRKIKEEIEAKKKEELEAQRQDNLELAAKIRYGDLSQLQKEQEEINQK